MTLILHNLKVAVRNLAKYKLQTLISVLSISIGIVTFSLAHSALSKYQLPLISNESYFDRAYMVRFEPMNNIGIDKINETRQYLPTMEPEETKIDTDIIRALKGNGALKNAEKIAVPNGILGYLDTEFHLLDSTIRKGRVSSKILDAEYPNYSGIRSAITGEKIGRLKKGEAIISEDIAKKIFGDSNPIGAVQIQTDEMWQPIPVTITDVFQSVPILENILENNEMYYCLSDSIEDYYPFQCNYAIWINVVLRDGCSEKDLQKEIDARIAPLGFKSLLTKVKDNPAFENVIPIRMLIHTIGALILLAAIIGFLRIEIQLFQIRRRELALRITNGASRLQVFGCLVAEITIVITLSVIAALLLGILLQDFIDTKLVLLIDSTGLVVEGLWSVSLITGCLLLLICSLIAWVVLSRVMKEGEGLAANMRKSRSHLFRNAILGVQILICMVFVCCAFILVKGGKQILAANNVPERDSEFAEYFSINPSSSSDPVHLIDEISRLSDLESMMMCDEGYTALVEVTDNPEISEKLNGKVYNKFYFTTDTTLLSTLGMKVNWNGRDIDRNECFLLSEKTFAKFKELGILGNSTLTLKYTGITLPIGGTVSNFPYDRDGEFIVAFHQGWASDREYLLIPKKGRRTALAESLEETIKRVDPQNFNKMVFGFRENLNLFPSMVEAAKAAGWILAVVSLIICSMSIFSTIALDTRARRKEVAIRKVNGAKSRDIYRMFGRTYAVLILASLILTIPVCILFNRIVEKFIQATQSDATISPAMPIVLGILTVIFLTFIIVYTQIHRVMQLDPSKIISKE